ncbi:MAG TPA: secondary thiamine-phosphate synthase enzyme YjbQ [Anaerolineales bacterium]
MPFPASLQTRGRRHGSVASRWEAHGGERYCSRWTFCGTAALVGLAPAWYALCMQLGSDILTISTRGQGLYEFTGKVRAFISSNDVASGLVTLFVRHTSCSLLIQENADPDVQTDLAGFFARLVPEGMDWLVHTTEGPDDMPAHIKASLTQTSIGIPIIDGEPALGTWQGIYLFEHRRQPHRREVAMHLIGER